jgi:large subunit ribosomal protein L11
VAKGSGVPNRDKVGKVTMDQVKQIAQRKINDLNSFDLDAGCRQVMGTARSMGIEIEK